MSIILPTFLLAVLGLIIGIFLSITGNVFAIKEDEKLIKIKQILPGANCGACGYLGCEDYAKAVLNKTVGTDKCKVGGEKVHKLIDEIING